MLALPAGTVTFLFTDVQGSTVLLGQHPQEYRTAIMRHHALLREAVECHGGVVFETVGDAVYAAFALPSAAVAAAVAGQRALQAHNWGEVGALQVRMGLHTGEVERQGNHYFGVPLYRCARLMAAAHGGQVVLSSVTAGLVREGLPAEVTLWDLGMHQLKDLQQPEHIYQVSVPDLPAEFPRLKTVDRGTTNLPAQPTPLVGREDVLAQLAALLSQPEVRLLTLTGPGGIGKTRLALQLAADMLDRFTDGAYLVDLAPLTNARLVGASIAAALGLRESGGPSLREIITDYLHDKHLLLLLDNFEQVLDAAALVGHLMTACPHLRIVSTSRTPLRVYGEHEYAVPPLALPPRGSAVLAEQLTQYAAVTLFIQRAQDVQPAFQVTNATAAAVAEICARLDGLPLAIELAAARVRLLPPPALLARLSNRLGMLTGGARTLPARQQTLRAAIDWSYQLLSPPEQTLFARLSVFVGGCTLEAVEAVCLFPDDPADGLAGYDVLEGMASLVEKSLLRREDREESDARFMLLETLHEYAREQLVRRGETESVRVRHATCFLSLAEQAATQVRGPEQQTWLARLEADHDNLRAVLGWAQQRPEQLEVGLRVANALAAFWSIRGHLSEGRAWLEGFCASAKAGEDQNTRVAPAVWTTALNGAANMAFSQADYARASALHEESLALRRELGDTRGIANSLHNLGSVAWQQGDYARATALYDESLTLKRELGDTGSIASTLNSLGAVAAEQGDFARAIALYEESLALAQALGDSVSIAYALNNLGAVAQIQGNYARAALLYEESLALRRGLGARWGIANSLNNLGELAHLRGDYARASALHEESLALKREIGDKRGMVSSLNNLGHVAAGQAEPALARALYEESLSLARGLGDKLGTAGALQSLGELAYAQGDSARAAVLYRESLVLQRDLGDRWGIASSLEGLACAAAAPDAAPAARHRAVQLLSAAAALRAAIGAPLLPTEQPRVDRMVAALRATLGETAFGAAWTEGMTSSLEDAIGLALDSA